MAGINLICCSGPGMEKLKTRAAEAMEKVRALPEFENTVLMDNDNLFLTATAWPGYPLLSFQKDDFRIVLEGKLYGRTVPQAKQHLVKLAGIVFSRDGNAAAEATDWLRQTDGEFLVVILHLPSGRLAVLNDLVGRLPIYLSQENDKILLSRNYRFISEMLDRRSFDRLGIAEFLLFDFSLGSRTFLEGVRRVEQACMILIDARSGRLERKTLYKFNFDNRLHADKTIEQNGRRLAELFVEAAKARFEPGFQHVLSLSGGRDSRVEAAAFRFAGIPFNAATWLDYKKVARYDTPNARKIARVLKLDWRLFRLRPATGRDVLTVLRLKCGLIYFATAHLMWYYRELIRRFGRRIIFFTGNGGDRVSHDIRPKKQIKNLEELVQYVLTSGRGLGDKPLMSVAQVAEMTGIDQREIVEDVHTHLEAMPEQDMRNRYTHFCLDGQAYKRHHESSDRNRNFFWSTSMYWSIPFFEYIMNCPDEQKIADKLYVAMLRQLSPELCLVQATRNRSPVFQNLIPRRRKKPWYRKLAWKVYSSLRDTIRAMRCTEKEQKQKVRYLQNRNVLACLDRQIKNSRAVGQTLNRRKLEEFVAGAEQYGSEMISVIFAAVSVIEELAEGHSSLEGCLDANMDTYG